MTHRTAVAVVGGGGYADVLATDRLTQRSGVDVTLVNPRPKFVERIRLHQLAAGTDDAVVAYRTVLATRIRLVVGEAARVDASERRVVLVDGSTLGEDYLVYPVGSGSGASAVPGAAEHAYPFRQPGSDATRSSSPTGGSDADEVCPRLTDFGHVNLHPAQPGLLQYDLGVCCRAENLVRHGEDQLDAPSAGRPQGQVTEPSAVILLSSKIPTSLVLCTV